MVQKNDQTVKKMTNRLKQMTIRSILSSTTFLLSSATLHSSDTYLAENSKILIKYMFIINYTRGNKTSIVKLSSILRLALTMARSTIWRIEVRPISRRRFRTGKGIVSCGQIRDSSRSKIRFRNSSSINISW